MLLIIKSFFLNYTISQTTLECEDQSLAIGDAECIIVGGMDYLQFVVTYSNIHSAILISELPDGSRYVCSEVGDFTDVSVPPGTIFIDGFLDGECTIRLPGCDPVILNFSFTSFNEDCEDLDHEISVRSINPIPTLGTWALMILGLLFPVFAVVAIRKRSWAMA